MTLGDWIRSYFERRQNYHKNNLKNDYEENVMLSEQPKMRRIMLRQRYYRLPDGSIQMEIVTKDNEGNEETKVTRKEGNKLRTIITRRDASGRETKQESVTDINGTVAPEVTILFPNSGASNVGGVDEDYDYYFNKFFNAGTETPKDFHSDFESVPIDVQEQLKDAFEAFVPVNYDIFDDFANEKGKKANNFDQFSKSADQDDIDSIFLEEARKFVNNLENNNGNKRLDRNSLIPKPLQKEMEKLRNNFSGAKKSSLFDEFSEQAVLGLPQDTEPFVRFAEPDEEVTALKRKVYSEYGSLLSKLRNEGEEMDLQASLGERRENKAIFLTPNFVVSNSSVPTGSVIQSYSYSNGKIRKEMLQRDENGNRIRNVTYEIGKDKYFLISTMDGNGNEIKRETNFTGVPSDFEKFKRKWDSQYYPDFEK